MIITLLVLAISAIVLKIVRDKVPINKKIESEEIKGNRDEIKEGSYTTDNANLRENKLINRENKRRALFKRISERKDNIFYKRIGTAKKAVADDLTIITGIDELIVKKLNALNIHSFRQISRFRKEDIQAVNESAGFSPGRIEAEEWIKQAADLVRIAGNKADLFKRIRERKWILYKASLSIAPGPGPDNFNHLGLSGL
jgi:predicted flap endonuclease-1-like 5' DNA nuclease